MNKKSNITDNLSSFTNQEDDSLEKEFPLLHSIAKDNPFTVPEGYFESLPSIVIQRCRAETQPKGLFYSLKESIYRFRGAVLASISAMASITLICFLVVHSNTTPVSYEAMIQTVPDSLIVANLDKNISDINVNTLEDLQTDDNTSDNITQSDTSSSKNQQIITYLLDQGINELDIENDETK